MYFYPKISQTRGINVLATRAQSSRGSKGLMVDIFILSTYIVPFVTSLCEEIKTFHKIKDMITIMTSDYNCMRLFWYVSLVI